MARRLFSIFLVVLCAISFSSAEIALAAKKKGRRAKRSYTPVQTSLIIDGKTGRVLHASNARKQVYPASLTKVATLYLIFEALESGKIKMNQRFKVSKYAASATPLKLGLKAGDTIAVKDIIPALIIKSANDAARVAAEGIAGSEKKFAKLMTIRAKSLGMKHTNFTNASGLHNPKQKTTAVDLAKLTVAIKKDFPQYYHFFSKTRFNYRGKEVKGHNKLTEHYPGAEGLKTGFVNASGCNLITTATRGNKNLIGVVTGGKSASSRDQKMTKLLDAYFGPNTKGVKSNSQLAKAKITKTKISNNAVKSSGNVSKKKTKPVNKAKGKKNNKPAKKKSNNRKKSNSKSNVKKSPSKSKKPRSVNINNKSR